MTHSLTVATLIGAPEDLVVSFGVQNACIVATAHLQPHLGGLNATSSSLSLPKHHSRSSLIHLGTGSAGHHALGSGNPAENLVRVDSVVPAFTAAHEMLLYCTYSLNLLKDELCKCL